MDKRLFKRFNNAAGLSDLVRWAGRSGCYNAGLQKMRLDPKECFHLQEHAGSGCYWISERPFLIHFNLIYRVKTRQTGIEGELMKI